MRTRATLAVLTMLPALTLALGCAEATQSGAAHDSYILTRTIGPPDFHWDLPIEDIMAIHKAGKLSELVVTENRPYRDGEPVTIVERVLGNEKKATGRNLREAECELDRMRIDESLKLHSDNDKAREAILQLKADLEVSALCAP